MRNPKSIKESAMPEEDNAAKKTAVKKAAVKKAATKKTAAKKAATKKTATKKAVKKVARKTAGGALSQPPFVGNKMGLPPRPAADREPQLTTVIAKVDVGWGNSVYIRGEGGGLSWNSGRLMDWNNDSWTWSTTAAVTGLTFKFILNDEQWAEGENLTVPSGGTSVSTPEF